MKNLRVLSVLALMGLLVVSCATLSKPSLQYSNEQVAEFERAVIEDLNTPKKVNRWLFNNFAYDNDELRRIMSGTGPTGGLVFNHPIETYFNKWGVCCDAANFAGYC